MEKTHTAPQRPARLHLGPWLSRGTTLPCCSPLVPASGGRQHKGIPLWSQKRPGRPSVAWQNKVLPPARLQQRWGEREHQQSLLREAAPDCAEPVAVLCRSASIFTVVWSQRGEKNHFILARGNIHGVLPSQRGAAALVPSSAARAPAAGSPGNPSPPRPKAPRCTAPGCSVKQ